MEDLTKIRITNVNGQAFTKDLMALLERVNSEYYQYFMSKVYADTKAYYRCTDPKYVEEVLYMKMYRYQQHLCEMLDQSSPKGYYFGLFHTGAHTYGFWPEEKERASDEYRQALIKQILAIIEEKKSNPETWRSPVYTFFHDDKLEMKLRTTCSNEELEQWLRFEQRLRAMLGNY